MINSTGNIERIIKLFKIILKNTQGVTKKKTRRLQTTN